MKKILLRISVTAILAAAGYWMFDYNRPQRQVRCASYTFSDDEALRLRLYPAAQYAHGMHAWLHQKSEKAARLFRQAISQDVLFMGAWLRLAETQAAIGREDRARGILAFTTGLSDQVSRWKWPQMVLAHELGMETQFCRDANYMLSRNILEQDVLQLLHTHFGGEASAVVHVLEPANLPAYLHWLMRWGMTDSSLVVWKAMTAHQDPDMDTIRQYVHFLLNRKRVTASMEIRQKYTGTGGLTNPGFETEITGLGFDWRHWGETSGMWTLKRVNKNPAEGRHALRITFNGRENISFEHLCQIFTASPQKRYRLTYAWKSRGITTDMGPFVEVFSYDSQGLYKAGPMITGTHDWREESVEFTLPDGCRAAVVRLRRRASRRFDSKIKGSVWMDYFRLEEIDP